MTTGRGPDRSAAERWGEDLWAHVVEGAALSPGAATAVRDDPAVAAELASMRDFAEHLRAAAPADAPPAAARDRLLAELASPATGAGGGLPALPLPPHRGRLRRVVAPLVLGAASLAAGMLLVLQSPEPVAPTPGVRITLPVGAEGVTGIADGHAPIGTTLVADIAVDLDLGAPVEARVRLDRDARLAVPPGGRALELRGGRAWFDVRPAAEPLQIDLPGPGDRGITVPADAGFTVAPRTDGALDVLVSHGTLAVSADGVERRVTGPVRLALPVAGPPGEPVPGESPDARAWFHHPEVDLSVHGTAAAPELLVRLTLDHAEPLSIAPWDPVDTAFTLRIATPDGDTSVVGINNRMLLQAPPESDGEGAFRLRRDRPYLLRVDTRALGLPPGRYTVEATYDANSPGGLWRGSRASNSVDVVIPAE